MVAVRMMESAIDDEVGMVTMRDGLMATILAVSVARFGTGCFGHAASGVGSVHFKRMLVVMVVMRMMEMAIMEVIDMVAMFDRRVAAIGTMFVVVILVNIMLVHNRPLKSMSVMETSLSL